MLSAARAQQHHLAAHCAVIRLPHAFRRHAAPSSARPLHPLHLPSAHLRRIHPTASPATGVLHDITTSPTLLEPLHSLRAFHCRGVLRLFCPFLPLCLASAARPRVVPRLLLALLARSSKPCLPSFALPLTKRGSSPSLPPSLLPALLARSLRWCGCRCRCEGRHSGGRHLSRHLAQRQRRLRLLLSQLIAYPGSTAGRPSPFCTSFSPSSSPFFSFSPSLLSHLTPTSSTTTRCRATTGTW